MIIKKSHISTQKMTIDDDLDFSKFDFKSSYPILGVASCHIYLVLSKDKNGIIKSDISIDGTFILEDSYTAKPFKKKIKLNDSFNILEKEDGVEEGFIIEEKEINVLELVLAIVKFNLPVKVLSPHSKLPKGGDGYTVYSSDDDVKDDSSPFDVLKDLDL